MSLEDEDQPGEAFINRCISGFIWSLVILVLLGLITAFVK